MAPKKSFLLRIDPEIYDALEKWANDDLRSINGHLEYLLRESLRKSGRLKNNAKKKNVSDNDKTAI